MKTLIRTTNLLCIALSLLTASTALATDNPGMQAVPTRYPDRVQALGQTQQTLQQAFDRLQSPPLSDIDFVLSDVHFKYKRRFTNFSGDISGRVMGALQSAAPVLNTKAPMAEKLANLFPEYQKPDGHFGTEQNLDEQLKWRDMPILWGNGRLLLAMAQRCMQHDEPKLLNSAKKLGDYIINTRKYYGQEENFEKIGGLYAAGYVTCYFSLIDGLAALYEVTGQQKYLNEARFIAYFSLKDQQFKDHHSHGRLSAYRGMLDLDRLTGQNEFLPYVTAGWQRITEEMMLPTGGLTEKFNRDYPRDEGCTEADWIRVNFLLWRATGETKYLDVAECALRNHLVALQQTNGGFGHFHLPSLQYKDESYPAGGVGNACAEAYWCCSMQGTQLLADATRYGVVADENTLYVNWLSEVRSQFDMNGRQVMVTVEETKPTYWKVNLELTDSMPLRIRLRVPGWAKHITVNDQAMRATDGWVTLKANKSISWNVSFPNQIRRAGPYAATVNQDQPVRLFVGPDLLCLPMMQCPSQLQYSTRVPRIQLMDTELKEGKIQAALLTDSKEQKHLVNLVSMRDRPIGACQYLFDVVDSKTEPVTVSTDKGDTKLVPVEITFAAYARWTLYLNGKKIFERTQQGGESPTIVVPAKPGLNVLSVVAQVAKQQPGIIGFVRHEDQIFATKPKQFSAIPCPENLNDWLTDPHKSADNPAELLDIGPWCTEPWDHQLAEFADTDARWIWPASSHPPTDRKWLLHTTFMIPQP